MMKSPDIGSLLRRLTAVALLAAAVSATGASAASSATGTSTASGGTQTASTSVKKEVWSNGKCGTTIRRVPNKRKKYRVPSKSAASIDRPLSEAEEQKREELRKKLECLRRIHEIQKNLVKSGEKMSRQQQKRQREKIRQLQKSLENDIAEAPDFPFPTRMPEMDQVVSDIIGGKAPEFRELAGKDRRKVLDAIHEKQIQSLTRQIENAK